MSHHPGKPTIVPEAGGSPICAARLSAPEVEVVIEVPRGSFLKRGSNGHVDFVSPLPCPFNYGSVPTHVGLEGDLLDALVLGPRLPLGTRIRVKAWGAITLTDRGMCDDKLICSNRPLTAAERRNVLRFFRFYAKCKGLLNLWRHRSGRNACEGWRRARRLAVPVRETLRGRVRWSNSELCFLLHRDASLTLRHYAKRRARTTCKSQANPL